MTQGLKVFISYAHEDEEHKNTLIRQLAGLARRGLVDTWDDRSIDPGADWQNAISHALYSCNMALFLVSADFLASDFIHSVELNRLLVRREEEGIRVVPIIVRPCAWSLETIGTLQALPKDGRPITTFPVETGEREQAWTDITLHLASWAEAHTRTSVALTDGPGDVVSQALDSLIKDLLSNPEGADARIATAGPPAFEKWPALLDSILQGRCTPIIGPGLTEWLVGSNRELASQWAEDYGYPMEVQHRDDLPHVAQYLSVQQDPMFPRNRYIEDLRRELLGRHGTDMPAVLHNGCLDEMMSAAVTRFWRRTVTEAHRVLARLPLPLYITTDPSDLLERALITTGKAAKSELCRWNEYIEQLPSLYDAEPSYRPDPNQPLVYHLFGRFNKPDSLVLTEDDYFDFLMGVTRNRALIP